MIGLCVQPENVTEETIEKIGLPENVLLYVTKAV